MALRLGFLSALCLAVTACGAARHAGVDDGAEINTTTKFSEAEYGVAASERVTTSKSVPKGGGRAMIGKPYKIRGKWYTPKEQPDYHESGLASWYGPNFHGRYTANGEIYDQHHLSAAHPTLPLPSYARITNKRNGHSVLVRVNDRGPFAHGRIIDVSSKAADLLDFKDEGVAMVNVQYVGPARMDGFDMPFLMASYRTPGGRGPVVAPDGHIAPGVMLAMNEQQQDYGVPGVDSDLLAAQAAFPPSAVTARPRSQASASPGGAREAHALGTTVEPQTNLPPIGPVPPGRPALLVQASPEDKKWRPTAAAYAERRIAASAETFDQAMVDAPSLTAVEIVGAWRRWSSSSTPR